MLCVRDTPNGDEWLFYIDLTLVEGFVIFLGIERYKLLNKLWAHFGGGLLLEDRSDADFCFEIFDRTCCRR